jgi:steroid 5-alpha reductase family enzyme
MSYFLILAFILFLYMNMWFFVSLIKKRNDIADIAWGIGFILMSLISLFLNSNTSIQGLVISILITIWGLRLSVHIYKRNKGKKEDYRYLTWRQEWGKWFYVRSYFQVYILQGVLLFLIVFPVLLLNKNIETLTFGVIESLGLLIWVIGFYFEVVGDAQLSQFVKDPLNKGKLMQSGLWAYTRHPNYFGEVTMWWGIWVMTLGAPLSLLGIIGPLTITFLILKVSGIPLLEKKMQEHPDFAEYKKRVSVFVPLPRK